ncbi:MAG: hypothetical protein Kow0090_17830 [Myxococcota bacterium]
MEITGQFVVCQTCGETNPKEARFCRSCGNPLAAVKIVSLDEDHIGDAPTDFQFTDQDEVILNDGEIIAGRYRVVRNLGGGGMGKVYQVWDMELEEAVALKLLLPALMNNEKAVQRFKQEILLCRKLKHPNIVSTYEFGEHHGLKFFTMAFIEGRTLTSMIADMKKKGHKFVPVKVTLPIIVKLLDALHYAHQFTVHRDVKPDNILLAQSEEPILTDFGIAHAIERGKSITGTGKRMGTAYYMAPEQISKASEVDHRADIFSAGVIAYEMLTGRLPVGRFRDPELINTALPRGLGSAILKALEEEPDHRFASAQDMKNALDLFLRPESDARSIAIERKFFDDDIVEKQQSQPKIQIGTGTKPFVSPKKRSNLALWLFFLLFLVLAASLGLFFNFHKFPPAWQKNLEPAYELVIIAARQLGVNEDMFHSAILPPPPTHPSHQPESAEEPTPQEQQGVIGEQNSLTVKSDVELAISIDTTPFGADIVIDGQKTNLKTPARQIIIHSKTPHEIILSKEGFVTKTLLIKPPYKELELLSYTLDPKQTSVIFISYPEGAEVLFGETQKAKTPLIIKKWNCLDPLPYFLSFPSGEKISDILKISPTECDDEIVYVTKRLAVAPSQINKGTLNLYSSPPNASIKIDGEEINYRTPLEGYPLSEGTHIVEVYNKAQKCRGIYKVKITADAQITQSVKCTPI